MRTCILTTLTAIIALSLSTARAETAAITCADLTIPISGVTDDTGIEIDLTSADLLKQCTSVTGASLTLVNTSASLRIKALPGQTQTVTFTVEDTSGNQASAKVVVTRD